MKPIEERTDIIKTEKIRSATAVYDDKDHRVELWRLMTDAGEVLIPPMAMRGHPERIIEVTYELGDALPGFESFTEATVTCSALYKPITHQKVLNAFLTKLRHHYGDREFAKSILSDEKTRMVRVYYPDPQQIKVHNETLEFGLSITNSYDCSYGIHIDGYLYERNVDYGIFLGLAGSWKSTLKHYHDDAKLNTKVAELLKRTLEAKDERIAHIQKFATIYISAETFTKVGRMLNLQRKEIDSWCEMYEKQMNTVWVKNAGFTVTVLLQPTMTAWDMLKCFAKWSIKRSDERKFDIAQRLYQVVDAVIKSMENPE